MITMLQLFENLDHATYVRFIPDDNILFVWHGGSTINIYGIAENGKSVVGLDAFSYGDPPSIDMIDERIVEYVAELQAERR